MRLQLGGKAAEIERRGGHILQQSRPIDHQQGGAEAAHQIADRAQDPIQPAVLQGREETKVVDPRADVGRVEKAKPGQVREHPIMGLGHQGGEDGDPPCGRMGEGQLVAQRGLAGAGGAGQQVGATDRQPAAQDLIETRDPGRKLR